MERQNHRLFTPEVTDALKHYVYRLIDPRNGETFYVGKGVGNRVFQHAAGEIAVEDEELSDKLQRNRRIRQAGFEVAHVIHRHGLKDDETAFEVEAALIDAYPEVLNVVGGHDSDDRGVMHSKEIIEKYQAEEAVFRHRLVVISINRTAAERGTYEAVRYAWKVDPRKVRAAEYVLAAQQGIIIGAYVAERWLEATTENFPGLQSGKQGRWGFVGREAGSEIWDLYVCKRVPAQMRKRGAANPVKYVKPDV